MMASINLDDLRRVCAFSLDDFKAFFPDSFYSVDGVDSVDDSKIKRVLSELDSGDSYIYIDRGADILGVAHMDYVNIPFHYCEADLSGLTVFSPRLDDRLGVWGLLYALPDLVGCNYDILLTTGEESGRSSASLFNPSHNYNWIFELDRGGRDCVTYGIDSKMWRGALGRAGWSIGRGSFSDICSLDDLGVCAVNFGVGYHDAHNRLCHAFVNDIVGQLKKIALFIDKYHLKRFDYEQVKVKYSSGFSSWGGRVGYGAGDSYNNFNYCAECGRFLLGSELSAGICDKCLRSMDSDIGDSDIGDSDVVIQDSICEVCGLPFALDDLSVHDGCLICSDCFEWFASVDKDSAIGGDSADSSVFPF